MGPVCRPFPFLKDKTPLITALHRDKQLPFNVLRDVLGFKFANGEQLEDVKHTWLSYVSMSDVDMLSDGVKEYGDVRDFWCLSIRLANGSPLIMNALIQLWRDPSMNTSLQMPIDTPELLVASLIYHEKFDSADRIFDSLLTHTEINWKPIVDVSMALDSTKPLDLLTKLYSKAPKKQIYTTIMPHLRSMGLQESYLNRWNNILISMGDFPKESSLPMDVELRSMLDGLNMRSFKNCLNSLAKLERPEDWLQVSTMKLLCEYILKSEDQQDALISVLKSTTPIKQRSFWRSLYTHSNIPFTALDDQLRRVGISPAHSSLTQARLKRSSKTTTDHFWDIVASESRPIVINQSSASIVIATVRSSTLEKALDLALHLLSVDHSNKSQISRSFIVESTKEMLEKEERSDVLDRFERFLHDNGMMKDKIQNYFIYSDLSLGKINSAVSRLEFLLSSNGHIDVKTVDHVLKYLTKMRQMGPRSFISDSGMSQRVFNLTLRAVDQCEKIPDKTWNKILLETGEHYEMEMISEFFLKTVDMIKRKSYPNIPSMNPQHPLRQVFSDELTYKILDWGFMKNPENPWSGFELIKALEARGVYFQQNLVKKHLVKLTKILHKVPQDSQKIPKRLLGVMNERCVTCDVGTTIDKLNEIYRR
jgi:hypothetical protein